MRKVVQEKNGHVQLGAIEKIKEKAPGGVIVQEAGRL